MAKRTYGPWVGFNNAVNRDLAPLDRITSQSKNAVIDSNTGAWSRRGGTLCLGDNPAALVGLFESKIGFKGRQISELVSSSLADGLPTYQLLSTYELTGEGTIYYRSTNGAGFNHVLGDDFGAFHYPRNATTLKAEFMALPLKQRHSPATAQNTRRFNRFIDSIQRGTTGAGARKTIQMAGQEFCPALDGTPWRWRRTFNDSNASGTEINRIMPWLNLPPLGELTFTFTDKVAAGGSPNWPENQSCYYTYAFLMEDGSISMPLVPRPISTTQPSGYQFVLIPDTADANIGYKTLTVTNIQRGPKGCVGRVLLRSPIVSTGVPSPNDLRIVAVLNNNTQTSYVDTLGSNADLDIVKNTTLIRWDHMAPWRARQVFKFDERACIGYCRPRAEAFFVAEWRSSAGTYQNVADEDSVTATPLGIAVREDQTGAKTTSFVTDENGVETLYNLATYALLQDLLDKINVSGAAGGYWRGQLCPGTDLNAPTANLELTQIIVPSHTNSNKTVNPQAGKDFNSIAVGMTVTGANIPASTVVTGFSGADVLISNNATATGNTTLTFGWDTGDTAVFAIGKQRCYSCNYPAPVYMNEAYVDQFGLFKQRLYFTSGEPGHARNAPCSFYTGNRLQGHDDYGIFMGGAELANGVVRAIACFSKTICVITNPKGNSTGLDADYRLIPINLRRGCIASDSIVAGDGWVSYLTPDGLVITDGFTEQIITRDVFNSATGSGELPYEIQQCRKGAARDSDDEHFHAGLGDGKLYISYRSSAGLVQPNSILAYDFSASLIASGLKEVMAGEGQPFGWSAPYRGQNSSYFRPGTIGSVRLSQGLVMLYSDDRNQGSNGDGRIQQFEHPSLYDDGATYQTLIYCVTDRFETLEKKAGMNLSILYGKDVGNMDLVIYRDVGRLAGTVIPFPSGTSAGMGLDPAERLYQELPIAARSNADVIELLFRWIDSNNANQFLLYGLEFEYEVVPSLN